MLARSRLQIKSSFVAAVGACGLPHWHISLVCGCSHPARFSNLLHSGAIPDSPRNRELFERVCDLLKLPRSAAFVVEPISRVERLRARVAQLEREFEAVR